MFHTRHAVILLLGLLVAGRTTAVSAEPVNLIRAGKATVAEITDGDTLVLRDGTVVRLVGIQAPKLPLGRPEFMPWPLGSEALETLKTLALGKTISLSYGGARSDRYRRALAHVHLEDGVWVQGEMLRRGMARVYSFRDNRARVTEMLAYEQEARANGRGIWALNFYAVKPVEGLDAFIDSFQVIEGQVVDAARIGKYTYLNFGPDYRTDFTISVAKRDWRLFEAAGLDLLALAGRNVRVRGWLDKRNGPMIEITHPEQLELLP